uniref:ANK_REP_REGION domain-containing protein n=1 Tax=Globodera pallida TaxID=36090 RepID=A0A183CIG2_GLOPA
MEAIDRDLLSGCCTGELEAVYAAIENGANLDVADEYGHTPLMKTAMCGHIPILDTLLANGANVAAQDSQGITALGYGVVEKYLDVCEKLVSGGAGVHQMAFDGLRSPWFIACEEGHFKIVEMFVIASGQLNNLDLVNARGQTGLILACTKQRIPTMHFLRQFGADVNKKDRFGKSARDYAAELHLDFL